MYIGSQQSTGICGDSPRDSLEQEWLFVEHGEYGK